MAEDLAAEADGEEGDAPAKKKPGLLVPILFGLVLAMALGIGAAVAVMTGIAPIPGLEKAEGEKKKKHDEEEDKPKPKVVFVALDPLLITIRSKKGTSTLRLQLSIETTEPYAKKVEEFKPRILDALNTLMRAVDERDLSEPRAFDRLRAQMLRRIRLAADPTAIRDLLITEYVVL
ncbi:MAG: flagellar basal body-associated FliL family protein [Neomegalonema sp.]|nr:flagellar basal body-associated FliL family protein [Neomegalonema sp.]